MLSFCHNSRVRRTDGQQTDCSSSSQDRGSVKKTAGLWSSVSEWRDEMLNELQSSPCGKLTMMSWKARRYSWLTIPTSLNDFVCSFARLECQAGQEHSTTYRTTTSTCILYRSARSFAFLQKTYVNRGCFWRNGFDEVVPFQSRISTLCWGSANPALPAISVLKKSGVKLKFHQNLITLYYSVIHHNTHFYHVISVCVQ